MTELQRIAKQEALEMPAFKSHEAAFHYFEEKYGEKIVFEESSDGGKQTCYFYRLIIDEAAYIEGVTEMNSTGNIPFDFLKSYQPIRIWEDGRVEVDVQ
ncbi:hypothetical protein BN1080_02270 [Planococcus massiliensis]|uniref:Uncharacterized protein n=1 Tax=Planococcus massiliensis TaxID=1499687 RepID=A0A098EM05_9BACL|nr:hypothetical protein [Planococcus massiliensis]CEG23318.1 hypothetical protein BN1080_02270 [Planococcus massiliensis]